jgi:hypothetical protein
MANPPSKPRRTLGDDAEDSFVGPTQPHKGKAVGAAAPEVSQGAWRERSFVPRGTMTHDEMLSSLDRELSASLRIANQSFIARTVLDNWLPVLRQSIEQYGGDGIDGWLLSILEPQRPAATTSPFVGELAVAVNRLLDAATLAEVEQCAARAIDIVKKQTTASNAKRLSFKQMERLLEGKLEVQDLFFIQAAGVQLLHRRLEEILSAMETIKDQMKQMPGKQPDGMYSNFVRLKIEAKVIDAEIKHRERSLATR